jgi:hypothetical protein
MSEYAGHPNDRVISEEETRTQNHRLGQNPVSPTSAITKPSKQEMGRKEEAKPTYTLAASK